MGEARSHEVEPAVHYTAGKFLAVLVLVGFVMGFTSSTAVGAEPGSSAVEVAGNGLVLLDWLVIGLYCASVLGVGWYYSRKQESAEEYFVGSGKMNPMLVGVSLFATLLSTISYLSLPGEGIAKGPVWLAGLVHIPVSFLIVGYWLMPALRKRRVITAYELLEERLGYGIRALGAAMFVVMRLIWMSVLIYMASKATTIIFGIPDADQAKWIPWIALGIGSVAVIYSSMGGMRAVIVTDIAQTTILFGGALLVLGIITWHFGGFSWFPTEWQPHWDSQPFFSFDPSVRVSLVGVFIGGILWCVCTAGGDQTAVQRFMSTENVSAARRSYLCSLLVMLVVQVTLFLVGFGLMAWARENVALLPAGMNITNKADGIFPQFIAFHLPPGVSGLVVAAMLAAGMSSIDSGINSITAVVSRDFLDHFNLCPKTERGQMRFAKILAFSIGAVVVICSSLMDWVPGNFTAVTNKTVNLLMTPLFALMFFALFVPFARTLGVVVGSVCGFATAILIGFSGPIFGQTAAGNDPVSFMWITPVALAVNIGVGSLVSLMQGTKK